MHLAVPGPNFRHAALQGRSSLHTGLQRSMSQFPIMPEWILECRGVFVYLYTLATDNPNRSRAPRSMLDAVTTLSAEIETQVK
jgi:hypothetical protein